MCVEIRQPAWISALLLILLASTGRTVPPLARDAILRGVPHDDDLRIAAVFDPPVASARYERWRELNAELLSGLSPADVRVDVGRAVSGGDFMRVWLPQDVLADVKAVPLAWPCVCCGCFTLPEPTGMSCEICPVCFWQDDAVDNRDTEVLGPNRIRLSVARANYERLGAHEERWLNHVRAPHPDELPPRSHTGW